ncbi:MAG: LysR family transcriptional regulator [Gammaproteobacteria bacterium]|nr:LysR family transcriptional regulator [Gammaproteobacteria bacterium]
MDLELLRTFLEVARLRHFGQAAEALHLTQAAVSARIKLLEATLDVRLFDRIKRDIRLTPEGNRLLRHADLLIAGWRKARQEVTVGNANLQLSFGGGLRLWEVFLQEWLQQLRIDRPEIALIAESHSPEVLTRRLLDGVIDLAFMLEPAQIDILHIQQVTTLKLGLVSTRPDIGADEALGDGYLMVDWGLAHALTHRRLFPDAPEPMTRLATAGMAISYMLAIGGSAYVPLHMVERELATGQLYRVGETPGIEYPAYAVYPVRGPRTALIRQVLPVIHEVT